MVIRWYALSIDSFENFVQHVAAGRIGVSRQDVAVPEARNPRLLDLAVQRHGGIAHADRIDRDFVRQQHLQHLGIAGAAAKLLAVADDEDDLAVLPRTVRQVLSGHQYRVIEHVRFFRWSQHRIGSHRRLAVGRWA